MNEKHFEELKREFEENLQEWTKKKILKDEELVFTKKMLREGEELDVIKCPVCGKVHIVKPFIYSYEENNERQVEYKCECGMTIYCKNYFAYEWFTHVCEKKEQGYIVVYKYRAKTVPMSDLLNEVRLYDIYLFDTKNDKFYGYSFNSKKSMRFSANVAWELRKVNNAEINRAIKALEQKKKSRKKKTIKFKKVDIDYFPIVGKAYDETDDGVIVKCVCSKCGTDFLQKVDPRSGEVTLSCPHCNNKLTAPLFAFRYHLSQLESNSKKFVYYENYDDGVLVRVIYVLTAYNRERSIIDRHAYLVTNKAIKYFEYDKDKDAFVASSKKSYPTVYFHEADKVQSDDEILEVINNSSLKYTGFAEILGVSKMKYKGKTENVAGIDYMKEYYKYPIVEKLLKANFPEWFILNLAGHYGVCDKDTSIEEFLGLPKRLINPFKENNSAAFFLSLRRVYNTDRNIDVDTICDLKFLLDGGFNTERLANLKETFGIAYKDVINYLDRVYDHQCIEKQDAFVIWCDYLNMASRIGINLNQKERKFPTSLKKEHDVAMFAYNALKEKFFEEDFAKRAEKNAYYNYKYGNYITVVPETVQDVLNEASSQKNCLRSYVNSIANGSTVIVFLRRKEEPKKSFISIEISNNKIVQFKGYCNSSPELTPDLLEFMKNWSMAKKFSYEPRNLR